MINTEDFQEVCNAINRLTEVEGNTVCFTSPNADFGSGPDFAIACQCDFTNYRNVVFYGDTVVECLEKAIEKKQLFDCGAD